LLPTTTTDSEQSKTPVRIQGTGVSDSLASTDNGQQANRLVRSRFQRLSLTVVNADIVLLMRRSGVRFPEAALKALALRINREIDYWPCEYTESKHAAGGLGA
jgi:hypothetical protein